MPEIEQYTCYDAPGRAQVVTIQWERLTAPDDCNDKPDERDEGFWPSLDKDAAGYIGDNPETPYDEQMEAARERMKAWRDGDWYYVGVIARAHISVPIGGGSFRTLTLDSGGVWGIESDAGDYLDTVFEEEKAELLSQLATLGVWAIAQQPINAHTLVKIKDALEGDSNDAEHDALVDAASLLNVAYDPDAAGEH